jgi:hypothetical protein
MARWDRRTWGSRELKRTTRVKTGEYFSLYYQGFGRETIASKLNMDLASVERMFEAVEGSERMASDSIATLGGGGQ